MDVRELIPKHADDQKAIDGLKKLPFEQIKPIVPDLLVWLQDMNWPVARPIAGILEPFVDQIVPEIITILKTDDGMWKYWILTCLIKNTTHPILLDEIERMAKFPSRRNHRSG
ncbi:MAG TPA: DUF5071 domain-containing protein [Mucilaginibacter sp.]